MYIKAEINKTAFAQSIGGSGGNIKYLNLTRLVSIFLQTKVLSGIFERGWKPK